MTDSDRACRDLPLPGVKLPFYVGFRRPPNSLCQRNLRAHRSQSQQMHRIAWMPIALHSWRHESIVGWGEIRARGRCVGARAGRAR